MRTKLCFTILAIAILGLFMGASVAGAETMKCRQVTFFTKLEVIQVGDVPDHIIGVYDQTGLASFDTGEVASLALKGTADYIKGSGPIQGYTIFTFEDGSTFALKWQGSGRADPMGKGSRFESTATIIRGTGRWAGIQGEGTATGRRFVPLGAGAQLYTDVTLTYTLPSK